MGLDQADCLSPGKKKFAERDAAKDNDHPNQRRHRIVHKDQEGDQRRQDDEADGRNGKSPSLNRLFQSKEGRSGQRQKNDCRKDDV